MESFSIHDSNLDSYINVELTVRQAVYLASLLHFHIENELAFDEDEFLKIYESLFEAIEPYGQIDQGE